MIKSTNRLGGWAIASVLALGATASGALADDNQSWLCKYLPSACGSDDNPGGLPGAAAPGEPEETTRGMSAPDAASAPPPAESAPAPAQPESPAPTEEPKSQE